MTGPAAAGRAAADRLAHEWLDRSWVPDASNEPWATAAVERLGEIMAAQPAMLQASMRGADKGASTLSPRPSQGLVECLQNADDLGATELRVAYRGGPGPELLIVHDGTPVTLADVDPMAPINGIYEPSRRETMLAIPLAATVTPESILSAVREQSS